MVEVINIEEALKLENTVFIDTRTPKEFEGTKNVNRGNRTQSFK